MMKTVLIEGMDGSGKTTLAKALVEALNAKHPGPPTEPYAVYQRFPSTDTPAGRLIHDCFAGRNEVHPKAILHLFLSDAIEMERAMQSWDYRVAVLDRHPGLSAYVYQSVWGEDDLLGLIRHSRLITPNYAFLLDLPARDAVQRMLGRSEEMNRLYESTDLDFVDRRRLRYKDGARRLIPHTRVLDANQKTADMVAHIISVLDIELPVTATRDPEASGQ